MTAKRPTRRKPHICKREPICACDLGSPYPSDFCEIHSGALVYPKQCDICGRFMRGR